ncbi:Protease KEX1 [Sparassis crispa]|uniref:Protease KEX1 n=1 Tax=Sparassis crispa TaxID=139825 RepID=A0A401GI77_9APHY|nr:Protease KEX1 [Sparassis crispa]GBE81896.1 Protease KEX1 [Sparassis crispa]
MRLPVSLILALLVYESVLAAKPARRHYATHDYYVMEYDPLAGASLAECVGALGVEVVEKAGELQNHWLVRTEKPPSHLGKRHVDPVLETFETLQQRARSRGHYSSRSEETLHSRRVVSAVKYLSPQTLRQRVKRAPPPPVVDLETSRGVAQHFGIEDPEFPRQWHLVNDEYPQHMMNVSLVWDMGYTGKGVISALVDDGLDYTNNDLADNFYAAGSYDFNDHLDLPTPTLFEDHHGTRCAGQIAAVKNDICGVGIAYDSKVAGLRILSGPVSDIDEAAALNYDYQNTSIFSCSWGPPDDGKSMEGPSYLIKKAIANGIQNGRDHKGSVFVFASGNGGRSSDQCNFDGYTNSIFSVTVAAVDYKGLHPDYSEPCAANLIVAYSSGSGNHITTTDRGKDKCSHAHGGTSAAAPNAAGVFALALGARPDLSWRDIQHLCVQTGQKINADDPDWERTATGNLFSYKYGYGSLNGYEFVKAALSWKTVKPQTYIDLPTIQIANGTMDLFQLTSGGERIVPGGVSSTMTVAQVLLQENNFEKLEHITVKVWITHVRRGDVEVELVSPHGIRSVLAAKRFADSASSGFPGWTFMTVKHWGEDPVGDWTIRVSDQDNEDSTGTFLGWSMSLWGSVVDPSKGIKVYEVPLIDSLLPPLQDDAPTSTIPVPTPTSKTHSKPTDHLPGDHGQSEGEASKPAFPGSQQTSSKPADDIAMPTVSATATATPTPDEGWFADLSNLVTNQIWFFIALGAVAIFGLGVGVYFWRRAVRRRANYTSLPVSDDVAMDSIPGVNRSRGSQRTKELYDAFGEVSDDEEEEQPNIRAHEPSPGNFHTGFLDDEDPSTAGGITPARYKDEPDPHEAEKERPQSPASASGSGDGSWEHASDAR